MQRQMQNLGQAPPAPAVLAHQRAIVVFEDRSEVKSLAWLRHGFRHCFCLVRRPAGWMVCDPLKALVTLDVVEPYAEPDLLDHYGHMGMRAIVGDCRPVAGRWSAVRPLTCVELVKRIVGLHDPSVWTPYQLYRALLRCGFVGR